MPGYLAIKKKFFLAGKPHRFLYFFHQEKNTGSFFTPGTHETKYTDTDQGDFRIILTYEGLDEVKREKEKKRGDGRRVRDRRWVAERKGDDVNEPCERVSCVYFTRGCLHRASLLQCPSRGRELTLVYTKRGARGRIYIYVLLIKTITPEINYYGNTLLISFTIARTRVM